MQATMRTGNNPTGLFLLLAVCAAAATWMVVSGHSVRANEGERASWGDASSIAVLGELTAFGSGDDGRCVEVILAWCPLAVVESNGAANLGRPSPHFKAYCGKSSGAGVVGIIGTTAYSQGMTLYDVLLAIKTNRIVPVYVTGYSITRSKFEGRLARDKCAAVDASYTVRILNMLLK